MNDYFSQLVERALRLRMPAVAFQLDEDASERAEGVSSQFLIYISQALRVRMILDRNQVLADVASLTQPEGWLDLASLSILAEARDVETRWDYSMTHSHRLENQADAVIKHLALMYPFLLEALDPMALPSTWKEYFALPSA